MTTDLNLIFYASTKRRFSEAAEQIFFSALSFLRVDRIEHE
jgi:hypothetical protein